MISPGTSWTQFTINYSNTILYSLLINYDNYDL